MLFSSWFFSGIILLVPSALCTDIQDDTSVNGQTSEQLQKKTESYRYNHPPQAESTQEKGLRKQKSISVNEPVPRNRTRTRGARRRTVPKPTTTSTSVIPVQVIYETEPTTIRSHIRHTTRSPVKSTTRNVVSRRRLPSNTNKKIDIRQTSTDGKNIEEPNVTENKHVSTVTVKSNVSSTTEFPKRSRGSYFKKRTEPPAPRVKILEEKNFVFAHSGNFHYSFLGGDGTKISSEGQLRSYKNDKTGEAVSGNVFYTDKDGNNFSLTYTADENGYRPVGAHLPTPPPVPPAIARALKYIADKTTPSPQEINT